MTRPFGLQPEDLAAAMLQFGVAEQQVRRDHAISHVLAALSQHHRDELTFFGGTALSRTHLAQGRLSEDVDLLAIGDRTRILDAIVNDINVALMRTHGRLIWSSTLAPSSAADPIVATTEGGIAIKLQLLPASGYQPWPTEMRDLEQRYRDAPPATLRVPTLTSFAAWKTATWMDRRAARDLFDLWALIPVSGFTPESGDLFARHGPTAGRPQPWMFNQPPSEAEWQAQLAGQTRLTVTARDALTEVRTAWGHALGETWS